MTNKIENVNQLGMISGEDQEYGMIHPRACWWTGNIIWSIRGLVDEPGISYDPSEGLLMNREYHMIHPRACWSVQGLVDLRKGLLICARACSGLPSWFHAEWKYSELDLGLGSSLFRARFKQHQSGWIDQHIFKEVSFIFEGSLTGPWGQQSLHKLFPHPPQSYPEHWQGTSKIIQK